MLDLVISDLRALRGYSRAGIGFSPLGKVSANSVRAFLQRLADIFSSGIATALQDAVSENPHLLSDV